VFSTRDEKPTADEINAVTFATDFASVPLAISGGTTMTSPADATLGANARAQDRTTKWARADIAFPSMREALEPAPYDPATVTPQTPLSAAPFQRRRVAALAPLLKKG
jgi:hypothetical protein